MKNISRYLSRGGSGPLFSFSSINPRHLQVIQAQMKDRKFSLSIMAGTCSFCRWGYPRVILCKPLFRNRPFPTLFWLSCPWLVLQAGRLESEGGVGEMEKVLFERVPAWTLYNMEASMMRLFLIPPFQRTFLKRYYPRIHKVLRRTEVGGIYPAERPTVKCLHLQLASFLAMDSHPADDWLLTKFPVLSCPDPGTEVCGNFQPPLNTALPGGLK